MEEGHLRSQTGTPVGGGRSTLAALAVSLGCLVLPTVAGATPPTLLSVSRDGGSLTAAWAIPPGMAMDFIEAGNSPAVTPAGDFPLANTILAESLGDFQTSYVSSIQVPEGIHYVHASAFDTKKCVTGNEPNCVDEWSNILTISIPPGVDKSTAFSFLDARTPQRVGKLHIEAAMSEPGTLSASGTVRVPGVSRAYKFKAVSAKATPGVRLKLFLRLPKKAQGSEESAQAAQEAQGQGDGHGQGQLGQRREREGDDPAQALEPRSPSRIRGRKLPDP
jgi:hypothetical protein